MYHKGGLFYTEKLLVIECHFPGCILLHKILFKYHRSYSVRTVQFSCINPDCVLGQCPGDGGGYSLYSDDRDDRRIF